MAVRGLCVLLAIGLASGFAVPADAQQSALHGPSFDCSKARGTAETVICREPALAASDRLMARLYALVGTSAFGSGPSNQRAAQRDWLKSRDKSCDDSAPEPVECLQLLFDRRNSELAVAALFREPDLALSTLYRLDPPGAPLIEAVYRFALLPPGADLNDPTLASERAQLQALIEPYARRLADDEVSFGRDILSDEGIANAEDALASEQSFARFAQVSSAYVEGGYVPRAIPCEAIARRPGLLAITGPVFGSTLDNFVLGTDCGETLPPLPQLDRLVERIWETWPRCDGTIRFAVFRGFVSNVNDARLATGRGLAELQQGAMPRVTGLSQAQVQAVVRELAAYYQQYDRATAEQAPALAHGKVRQFMELAHSCE